MPAITSFPLYNILTFPTRLLGSKTFSIPGILLRLPKLLFDPSSFCQSGYHRFNHRHLSPNEAKDYIIYASAAAAVHGNNSAWLEPFHFTPVSADKNGFYFDKETGLKAIVYEKDQELLITFGALGSQKSQFSESEAKLSQNLERKVQLSAFASLLGARPDLYEKADAFIETVKATPYFQNKKITLCGQCLGGSIASYVSLRQQIPSYCLNTFALGPGLQTKIGEKNLRAADRFVTHISVENDYFSEPRTFVRIVDLVLNTLGLRTAGHFGKRCIVGAIHQNSRVNHRDIYGCLVAAWKRELLPDCLRMNAKDHTEAKAAREQIRSYIKNNI